MIFSRQALRKARPGCDDRWERAQVHCGGGALLRPGKGRQALAVGIGGTGVQIAAVGVQKEIHPVGAALDVNNEWGVMTVCDAADTRVFERVGGGGGQQAAIPERLNVAGRVGGGDSAGSQPRAGLDRGDEKRVGLANFGVASLAPESVVVDSREGDEALVGVPVH